MTFSGKRPPNEPLEVSGDAYCVRKNPGESVSREATLIMGDGSLPNCFVYVMKGITGTYPPPQSTVELNQIHCTFVPHVLGVQVGQTLEINNFDATIHNVHGEAQRNEPFNLSQPNRGARVTRTFSQAEVMMRIKCDVHPWMSAWCGVVEHPFFAVTGKDGGYELRGLPPGEYVIEAWHELWGRRSATVKAAAGEVVALDFVFSRTQQSAPDNLTQDPAD